jgi:serine/threonine protein phosphatase PrpC
MRVGSPLALVTASETDVGLVREANEDFMAVFERPSGHRLLVVADGMGGHRGGSTASRLCVETVGDVFQRSSEEPEALLRDALETANDRIYQAARRDVELTGMGTTAVLVMLTPDFEAFVGHLGDSRAYLLRDSVMKPLTEDHTVVAAMQRRGLLSEEAAGKHPRRHELSRCVGFHPEVEPEVARLEVHPGDRFLLCSDGLSGQVTDDEIAAVLRREALAEAVTTLVEAANARGGVDNVTVVVAAVPGGTTTVIDSAPRLSAAEWLPTNERTDGKERHKRRIAGATAAVAALLALGMLFLTLSKP